MTLDERIQKPQSLFRSKWYRLEYAKRDKTIADPRNCLEIAADNEADAVRRFYEKFTESGWKAYTVRNIR